MTPATFYKVAGIDSIARPKRLYFLPVCKSWSSVRGRPWTGLLLITTGLHPWEFRRVGLLSVNDYDEWEIGEVLKKAIQYFDSKLDSLSSVGDGPLGPKYKITLV